MRTDNFKFKSKTILLEILLIKYINIYAEEIAKQKKRAHRKSSASQIVYGSEAVVCEESKIVLIIM